MITTDYAKELMLRGQLEIRKKDNTVKVYPRIAFQRRVGLGVVLRLSFVDEEGDELFIHPDEVYLGRGNSMTLDKHVRIEVGLE